MGIRYKGRPDEVRALDAFVKLMRAQLSIHARLDGHLRELGLKESQLGVLEMLLHLGPLYQSQIGQKLLLSRANITLLVDQLAERGLVGRERDPEDRRKITVRLTDEGRSRITQAFPVHVARIVEIFSPLTASEQEELARSCRKLGLANREHAP